jgi:glycosyltransferase involved in cell wall biosynthesis
MSEVSRDRLHVISVQSTRERGGAEYANVELLDALRSQGMLVKLLTDQPALAAGTEVPVTEVKLGPKLGRRTVVQVALGFPLWLWRLRRALKQAVAQDGPIDVLLLHFKKEQLMSALLPSSLTGNVVWAEWGRLPAPMARGLGRRAYLVGARRARSIVGVSESTRQSLVQAGVPAHKVDVVQYMLDGEELAFDAEARERYRREWGAGQDTFVLGCVSRMNAAKRNDVIVDALAHMPENVLLVFAGEGDGEDALRARAAGYDGRVHFLPTPRGYVQEVLSGCDVTVFAPQRFEGAPRSIAFGQLTERAVIATGPEGAEAMVLPGTGTIVTPHNDPRALAGCLEEYRLDPARRAREGAAGRALALKLYDRPVVLARWAERLRAAVEPGSSR